MTDSKTFDGSGEYCNDCGKEGNFANDRLGHVLIVTGGYLYDRVDEPVLCKTMYPRAYPLITGDARPCYEPTCYECEKKREEEHRK